MPPVKKHTLDGDFFTCLKEYFGVLDTGLDGEAYNSVLLRLMREVNKALVWILTNDHSKSAGRVFEPSDHEFLMKDINLLHGFFKAWDYEGPGSDSDAIALSHP